MFFPCLCFLGSFEFCSVQVQPPCTEGKTNHVWTFKDVPLVPQLLEAGDAVAVSPAHAERRWHGVQSRLHKVWAVLARSAEYFSMYTFCKTLWCFCPCPAGGCATATFHRVTTASRAMKPLRCLAAACSSPSLRWLDVNSWRSSEWRRTSCCQRNGRWSSHTFLSKGWFLPQCVNKDLLR